MSLRAKIVVCDDDAVYLEMIHAMLTSYGFPVRVAEDAAGLAALMFAEKPDLLILDMQLRVGGGPGIVKTLRGDPKTAAIPILISSGMPTKQQKKWFSAQKRIRFLQKPVEPEGLLKSIQELLSEPDSAPAPAPVPAAPRPEPVPMPAADVEPPAPRKTAILALSAAAFIGLWWHGTTRGARAQPDSAQFDLTASVETGAPTYPPLPAFGPRAR